MGESTSKRKKEKYKHIETDRVKRGSGKLNDLREWAIKNPSEMLAILEQPQKRVGWQYEAILKDYKEKGRF